MPVKVKANASLIWTGKQNAKPGKNDGQIAGSGYGKDFGQTRAQVREHSLIAPSDTVYVVLTGISRFLLFSLPCISRFCLFYYYSRAR